MANLWDIYKYKNIYTYIYIYIIYVWGTPMSGNPHMEI